MSRRVSLLIAAVLVCAPCFVQGQAQPPAWVAVSNGYTNLLLKVQFEHSPEAGSNQGLSEYDTRVSQPTLADEDRARRETEALLAQFESAAGKQTQPEVAQDLQILIHRIELDFREDDYARAHDVPFLNPSSAVFSGLRILLDDQTAANRRPAAVVRIREYAGLEPGYTSIADIAKQRVIDQMAKPGVVYPARTEIETELGRNSAYIDGIAALLTKYKLTGWQAPFDTLKSQLADYDGWTRTNVLPKARTDFRLPPAEYALDLEDYGIDIPPAELTAMAHRAFTDIQAEMKPLAAQVARAHHWPATDYRDVMRDLKKQQVVGDAILPLYEGRLKQIEALIREHQIVSLPSRPARIRIATAAETAQQPAPHMVPPPLLNNTGQQGEFVLPLNLPAAPGATADRYDDFTFDAAAWTLIAHEARPGHELQFSSMLEHGVSLARARFAFNSTNVEGWGLYAESLMRPYMPPEGRLVSLDYLLLRAARAFLDPELQAGTITPADADRVLEQDVVQSHAFAQEEVERYTYRAPGQANSYFYGYTKLLALRKDAEAAMGAKFNEKAFHDFILAQGLLPPDLLRAAVMDRFVKGR